MTERLRYRGACVLGCWARMTAGSSVEAARAALRSGGEFQFSSTAGRFTVDP